MKLYEYLAKEVFKNYGIQVPFSKFYPTKKLVKGNETIKGIPVPGVLKLQIVAGGRGKSGGIKFYNSVKEALEQSRDLVKMKIKDLKPAGILFEEKLTIDKEIYLGITIDRIEKKPVLLFSLEGGVEIENVAEDKILKIPVDSNQGLSSFHLRKIRYFIQDSDLSPAARGKLVETAEKLYRLFLEMDAELVEINPLAIELNDLTKNKQAVTAADAKMVIDNDAMFRHRDLNFKDQELTELEKEAMENNISFIELKGNIGVIANGAGLTMATMDILHSNNLEPGIFLDLGGTDDPNQIFKALQLMAKGEPELILVNTFGGMTLCDTVARGIIKFIKIEKLKKPIIVRIKGRNQEIGKRMLLDSGVITVDTIEEAADRIKAIIDLHSPQAQRSG